MSIALHVNIDHVATLRNARGAARPDPIRAAKLAIEAGADMSAWKALAADRQLPAALLLSLRTAVASTTLCVLLGVPMALVLPGMGVGPPQATSKEAAAPQAHKLLVRLNIFGPVMLTSLSMRAVNRVTPKVPPPDT